jgi:beta-lactamase regulating signal transducer with metallopeptidase domain
MTNELLRYLLSLTFASSAGIAAALLLRRPARHVFGCGASYSLWLLVPVAMLAELLPHPGSSVSITRIGSVSALGHVLGPASLASGHALNAAPSIDWRTLMLNLWCTGAALLAVYLAAQQRAFVKSLGGLSASRCVLRSARSNGCPALLGVLRPKIILPVDFRFRYTRLERLLILSHERTHLRRGDAACNAFVALLRCIFWFNPLVHLASSCFRVDQEFACDAAVMRDYPASRRTYAGAMLKTQLADLALPVGCHWRSAQGLKERVRMLKRRMPSRSRRLCGGALTALLYLVVGCTTWVAQPPVSGPKSSSGLPAQSPVTGPISFTAREVDASPGQPMVVQGGEVILPSGVKMEIGADNVATGFSRDPTESQILQGHVRLTITSPANGAAAHIQAMIIQTDRATLTHRPDGSLVVHFEKAAVQQVPAAGVLTAPLSLPEPETPPLVTPNFKDADLAQVAMAVGRATHRSFIIDPRVHVRVTMLSSNPMTPEAFYQAFLAILQVHGLAALPAVDSNDIPAHRAAVVGDAIWIVPTANGR